MLETRCRQLHLVQVPGTYLSSFSKNNKIMCMYIFVSYLQCISKDGRNKLMTPPTVTMLSRARSAPLSAEHNGLFWQVFPQFRNLNKIWLNSNIFWKRYSSSKEIWNKNCKYQIKFVCWIHYPFFLNFVVKLVTIFWKEKLVKTQCYIRRPNSERLQQRFKVTKFSSGKFSSYSTSKFRCHYNRFRRKRKQHNPLHCSGYRLQAKSL